VQSSDQGLFSEALIKIMIKIMNVARHNPPNQGKDKGSRQIIGGGETYFWPIKYLEFTPCGL
jgi:hypothetical protein